MAMRLFTREEFFNELERYGLKPTKNQTGRSQIWIDDKGEPYTIPYNEESYPDYILDEILQRMGKLYCADPVIQKQDYLIQQPEKVVQLKKQ